MALHNLLGTKGETIARTYLENKGYEIMDQNWCFGKTEVDLIAYWDQRIIFVEVKTRTSTHYGQPEEFVTPTKQKNLQKAADEYIYLMNFKGEIRFDIIAIVFDRGGNYQLRHVEDAFWY